MFWGSTLVPRVAALSTAGTAKDRCALNQHRGTSFAHHHHPRRSDLGQIIASGNPSRHTYQGTHLPEQRWRLSDLAKHLVSHPLERGPTPQLFPGPPSERLSHIQHLVQSPHAPSSPGSLTRNPRCSNQCPSPLVWKYPLFPEGTSISGDARFAGSACFAAYSMLFAAGCSASSQATESSVLRI